jgi:hypothetical protein
MGQRSQIYIRYRNGKNLVAMHLQWNYGYYMINRTYQLLDFIGKNAQSDYSNFKGNNFDISNSGNYREDLNILQSLIQINTTIGSWVGGHDLVKEQYTWNNENNNHITFKMNPENQDNNNGILVIDIKENGQVKYGLAAGYEDLDDYKGFKMISAREYFDISQRGYTKEYEEYKLENQDKELYDIVMNQINFIDNNFELLTDEEYKEIFDTEYLYSDCLKEKDIFPEGKPLF